ncbi:MAG: hypothetical protein ACJ72P_08710, partial [Nocardioides sp.]
MSEHSRSRIRPRPGRRTLSALAVVAGMVLVGGTLPAAQAAPAEFKYKTYRVPSANSNPASMTLGSDGNLWFTEASEFFTPGPDPNGGGTFHSNIGRITPRGAIAEFRVEGGGFPNDIVQGPGGVLYFTSNPGLGRITTAGVVLPLINAPFTSGQLAARGNDIWITDFNADSLWRYDTVSGGFTEVSLSANSLTDPSDVAVDSAGNVWFGATSGSGDVIARRNPAGNVTTFPVAGDVNAVSIASDGKVWFTDRFNSTVGFVNPGNGNQVFQRATLTADAGPRQITAGANGTMWFTQANVGNAARITADGATITEFG